MEETEKYFLGFLAIMVGILVLLAILSMSYPEKLEYKIIQENKIIGYTYNIGVGDNGCKVYYDQNQVKQGRVCGNYNIVKDNSEKQKDKTEY